MSQNIDPIVVEPMIINEIEIDLEEQPVRLRKLKRMIEPDEDNEQPEEIKIEKKNNFGAKLKKMAENKNDKTENLNGEETDKPAQKKPRKLKNKEPAKINSEGNNNDEVSTQKEKDSIGSVDKEKKVKKKSNNIKKEKKDEDQEKRGQKFLSVFSATESEKEVEKENEKNEEEDRDYVPEKKTMMVQESDEENDEVTPLKPKKRKIKKLNESITEIAEENEVKPKPKRIRKLKKIEEDDDKSIINEEDKNLEAQSMQTEKPKKVKKNDTDKTKVKQSKPVGESTQTIFEKLRLDPTFVVEEESDKYSSDNVNDLMLPNRVFGVKKEKAKKTDHHIIKTRNKFFKEINTLETPQIDEAPNFEEEYIESRDLIVEPKNKNKSKATIENFLSKLQIYKDEHTAPAAMNSQNKSNLDPAIADGKNDIVVPRQGDVLNMDNENKDYTEKQSRPHALLKSSSLELSKFLNNTLSNFSIEENSNINLQISIPSQGKGNHVHDTTLFVNKLARSNSVLNKSLLTSGGLEKKISGSSISSERELYRNQLLEEVRKRKSKHINVTELHERFKQTDFSELTAEKRKKNEKNSEQIEVNENQNNIETNEGQVVDPTTVVTNNNNVDPSTQVQTQVLDFKQMIALEEGIEEEEESLIDGEEENQEQNNGSNNLNENKNLDENTKLSEKTPNKISNEMAEEKNDYDDGEETLEETRVLKKLRKLANTFSEKYNVDKQKVEKKITKSLQDPRIKQMLQKMFEVEAELGSDNEENDEMVKQINKKDADENDSEGEMDEELRQMIDNDVEFDEKDEEKLMDKFYKDLIKQDKENLKKVMERAYLVGNKRKNADFGLDENDMMKKKTDMINERIKLIEDRESMYILNEESTKNQKSMTNYDIFDEKEEENMIKMREINSKIRKEVEKKIPKIDESQILDKEIVSLLNIENKTINMKENFQNKFENKNKLLNSVLQVKNSKSNISIFNNAYNKEIVNEFGSKISIFDNLKKREMELNDTKPMINTDKIISTKAKPQMSSLNRLFSQRNNKEFNKPSPNKVFVFGFKK